MSRDIKSIGMDVHKEAVVIAVLNRSGKLVMESIVETKASSILEFIHGLRGELHRCAAAASSYEICHGWPSLPSTPFNMHGPPRPPQTPAASS